MSRSRFGAAIVAAALVAACSPSDTIPQPDTGDLPVAPESARVDLVRPAFSHPTDITNPLFPVSDQASVLLVGEVDGEPFRTEVTLLPNTRVIEWDGQQVEVAVSQYVAYLGGRIHEVAYDFYAQADDGAVWYFGEDVYNFVSGAIANTHGTWLAGRDGPAGMIMPGDPAVGMVYRPENIPGLVFEEVTVQATEQDVAGPFGPLTGAIIVRELHMDGATEDKSFAPPYGEFYTSDGTDTEALAMAVPPDVASGAVPDALTALADGALTAFEAALAGELSGTDAAAADLEAAWAAVDDADVPVLVGPIVSDTLDRLNAAVGESDAPAAAQAALDLGQSALDLQLRYRPVTEVDSARFDLWLAQLRLDAAQDDLASVNGDLLVLDYVRERFIHALDADASAALNLAMEELQAAVTDGDLAGAAEIARDLADR